MNGSDKKITIKDVAQMAGVSKGTVDRVIHKRGEVSQESLQRVLDVIERIGYKPNIYASLLASRRSYRIVCIIPDFAQGDFWEIAYHGIERAIEECRDLNLVVEVSRYDQFRIESFRATCHATLASKPDAVLLVPMFRDAAGEFTTQLDAQKIPYVFIESKISEAHYMAYYGMPSFESGYLAASLLLKNQSVNEVTCFRFHRSGDMRSITASVRQAGFEDYMAKNCNNSCSLLVDYLYPYPCEENIRTLDLFFERNPNVRHFITFNSRAYIVADYFKLRGIKNSKLLGFDPLDRNVNYLREGYIQWIIAQKCETQAYRGVMALCNHFIFKNDPISADNYMSMEILTAENVDYYIDLQHE